MTSHLHTRTRAPFALALLLFGGMASAQSMRTWVSENGNDANGCSRSAPCRTFAGALAKTTAGGEIDVLDAGDYGPVTIDKAITIDGGPHAGGMLASSSAGVVINAGPNDTVVLRNLNIEGAGAAAAGIAFTAGGTLHVENVDVHDMGGRGLEFRPSGDSELFVVDSSFRGMTAPGAGGVLIAPVVPGTALATLDGVRLLNNRYGLRVEGNARATISNCVASGNINNGLLAVTQDPGTGNEVSKARMSVENCIVAFNGTNATSGGIKVESGAAATLSNNHVYSNVNGLVNLSGQIISFGNNRIQGNDTDGSPTQIIGTM